MNTPLPTTETAARILESITDAFLALDAEWRFTYLNAPAERLLGRPRTGLLGRNIWEAFPEAVGSAFEQEYRRAVQEQVAVSFEEFFVPLGAWFEVRAFPSGTGLAVYFQDISQRRRVEAEIRGNEERFHSMAETLPQIVWTTGPDGSVDYYNQRWYEYSGLTFEQTRDWGWEGVIHPEDLARAGGVWRNAVASGTVSEVEYRLRRADGEYRWHLGRSVPLRDHAGAIVRWVGTATDIEVLKRTEAERERLLAEVQARAERETLLNEIGQAIRSAPEPDAMQAAAVNALGRALGAERCYFLQFDQMRDHMDVGQDFRRADLPSLAGEYRISQFAVDAEVQFRHGVPLVVSDTQAEMPAEFWSDQMAVMFAQMRVRALINVPLHREGRLTAALGVAMADSPRVWRPQEVALVEAVAAQMRSAIEAARTRRREHTIARQLQEALLPAIPATVPGLALAHFEQAALAETEGVGGDFADVFPQGDEDTFLVVGDLSGKGLNAAAQVATVRNMLRFALYNGRTLAGPVTRLNDTLAYNNLLAGFATLFVARYSAVARTLAYVNCGQEPALLRRAATGMIEQLPPTGPVIGPFPGVHYRERAVTLVPGDALAVFTDGLTEVGPSRAELLDITGVEALFSKPSPVKAGGESAAEIVARLIAGVNGFAQDGTRDDVCLLVGIIL